MLTQQMRHLTLITQKLAYTAWNDSVTAAAATAAPQTQNF